MQQKSVCDLVREAQTNDKNGQTTSSKYVTVSMREDIDTTEAYLNSKHTSGSTDYMGREKPFFNIVVGARNIWYRATDIDRKNIVVRATKESDEIKTFLATIKLQEWMKKQGFGKFLNDWGLSLASHGSSILKFIEKNGELSAQVMDWNNMLVDAVDFENNIKIERLWMTPAQLKKQKGYDQELVDVLLDNLQTRTLIGDEKVDNKSGYIEVFEVHGELSLAQFKESRGEEPEDGDEDEFFQQMHVVSLKESTRGTTEQSGYTLYSGREAKDPYMITHLIKKDGQTYAGGAVKNLFQAQWMINDTQKKIKDQLELASKIIFQTSDTSFAGSNVLMNIENGDLLTHKVNEPVTMLNNKPDIAAMQAFQAGWQNIASQINGISESMLGETAPSGTAWRQVQALLQESHSLFELMTENKGLAIIDMMTNYVIPYFKKQLDNTDEISSVLEDYQIKQIDSRYVPAQVMRRVNKIKKDTILSGQIYDPLQEPVDAQQAMQQVQSDLKGNQRFIKPSDIDGTTWKTVFDGLEWDLDIDVTGEAKDVQGAMATLTTVLQTISANPAVLQDGNVKLVFNKILSLAGGISPLELQMTQPTAQSQQSQAPINRVSESLSYKDAPPDIQRQIEAQAGLTPSQIRVQPVVTTTSAPGK